MTRFVLTEELRCQLKRPFGELLSGPDIKIISRLNQIIQSKKPKKVISVGDNVSRLLPSNHVKTDLRIIDNREMRQTVQPYRLKAKNIFKIFNPPGGIEDVAWPAIGNALKKSDSLLIVDGEEDLLTLVVVNLAPLSSLVIYGQPEQGVAVIQVDQEIKTKVDSILGLMCKNSD